jgi:anti-sigma regulatory factor (Ser/Thr protein kinase)/CheY-like chemotaxis protein
MDPVSSMAKIVAFPEPVRKRVLVVGENKEIESFFNSDFLSDEITLEFCTHHDMAIGLLTEKPYDLMISCGNDAIYDDIAIYERVEAIAPRPFKVIIVAPPTTADEVIQAMRAHVFSVFSVPFDRAALGDMIELAINAPLWIDGIYVVSAKPEWIALRVRCSRITAERLLQFGRELKIDLADDVRDAIMNSFRELLLNAMEHGAKFDPHCKLDVGYVRTRHMVLYYVRDPGTGFDLTTADCALNNTPEDPLRHMAVRLAKGLRAGGFGIQLARDLMDDLVYNDEGNEVLITKYLPHSVS